MPGGLLSPAVRSGALGLAVALGGWLGPAVARACSYFPDVPALDAPARDAEGVPTNPMLWVPLDVELEGDLGGEPLDDRYLLRAADGAEVELDPVHLGGVAARVLLPTDELAPQTTYDVVRCHSGRCDLVLRSFTTGDGRDDEAPALPIELGREDGRDRAPCGGKIGWVHLDIDAEGVLVADLGVPEFDEQTLSGRLDIATTERPLEVDDDDVGLTDVVPIRVGAFDLAGNFSGWQRLDPLHLPDGCGCTSGPSRPPLGLLVLLVLAVRRRGRAAPP